jgi:signal transduction histidine kinase
MNRLTIRVRLTAIYGLLFLLGGGTMIVILYVLLQQKLAGGAAAVYLASPELKIEATGIPRDAIDQLRQRQAEANAETLRTMIAQGSIALGIVTMAGLGFAWLLTDRALRPLHRIAETAQRVAAGNLNERIALTGPRDEVRNLADAFDSMLERLDHAFDGQRHFVANASHELRTPLTINRTLIEVTLGRPDVKPETRQLGDTLLAVNARHERLIDGLLTLVQSEQELSVHDRVDLADVARHVAGGAGGVEVVTSFGPAPTIGDPVLLERVVSNLVDNAVRYNVAEGTVWVSTRTYGATVEVSVANTGPVIPAYEVPGLFEPFRRLRSRTGSADGTGLGLSIVRSVAAAHHGSVDASPRPEGGLAVTVAFPLAVRAEPAATDAR